MNKILYFLICITAIMALASCRHDDPKPAKTSRVVLVYAVASNNLSSYLRDDMREMIQAAPDVAGLGRNVRVLLYSVPSQSSSAAVLSELRKDGSGTWGFQTISEYDRLSCSTDPERMRKVFADVAATAPSDKYGLVLWSHGTGWLPNFSSHEVPDTKRSFGMDKYQGEVDYCDIHELAEAIPDHMFDYVWFDLCYMMGIETAYQLRHKCEYVAGYPTEDWSQGMNYESTLPMLAASEPDLEGAARSFFDYYNDSNMAVTVTVARTEGLETLAAAAADIYSAGVRPLSPEGMQNYSRLSGMGREFYDFGQFTKAYIGNASADGKALLSAFEKALSDVVVYGACSRKNFNGSYAFDPDEYSGFSCHFPATAPVQEEQYYSSLDWVIDTRP